MTNETLSRAEILSNLAASHAALMESVAGLPDDAFAGPVADGWPAADMLAHLAGWDELGAHDMRRLARGRAPILADFRGDEVDRWNDAHIRGRRLFGPAQLLEELEEGHRDLGAALDSLPEAVFAPGQLPRRLCDIFIQHKAAHAAELRAWRQTLSA